MTTISPEQNLLTLVNVFHVQPGRQDELADLLVVATQEAMRHLPGFVSANIHKSRDGKRVVNYAQWRSMGDFEAMLKNPDALPHMKRATELADSYDPVLCDVVDSVSLDASAAEKA